MEILVGDYPYKQYSVIQGGDGGMEYAVYVDFGQGSLKVVGVTAHEWRIWFQHVASNESARLDGRRVTSFLEDFGLNKLPIK
jgi:hypothetical protein